MSETDFEARKSEIREQMKAEGMTMPEHSGEDIYKNGLDGLNTSGSRNGGKIIVPNERLAIFWRKVFRIQFTDGGWRDTETDFQMEHPFAYSEAEIVVDTSRSVPKFESYTTHERMKSPIDHFEPVPQFLDEMVYLGRLHTGDDSYDVSDVKDDLRAFEGMDFNIADAENCSKCNPDIY